MKIRQIIAAIIFVLQIFAFTACGENKTEKSADEAAPVTTEAATTEEDTTEEETTEYEGCLHDWGEWILIQFPSVEHDGKEVHYCSICRLQQFRVVERLPEKDHKVVLDVENILQLPRLPNGCEVVSLAIALNYMGYYVNPVWLSDHCMPQGEYGEADAFYTYVGDPKSNGMGCYAPCIVNTAYNYFKLMNDNFSALNISGATDDELEKWIDRGVPVILWGTTYMNCDPMLFRKDNFDGKEVIWRAYSHCLVLVGYTTNTYLFCDPLREGIVAYQKSDVKECRSYVYEQACVVYDPATVDLSE